MLENKSYVVSRSENEIVYKSSLKHDSPLLRVSPIMAKLQIEWTKGEPFPNGHHANVPRKLTKYYRTFSPPP